MSYRKATKNEEQEFKEYTAAPAKADEAKTETKGPGLDTKGLQKELEKRSIDYTTFAAEGQEGFRKKVLKDDYNELRVKYQWPYDQLIES